MNANSWITITRFRGRTNRMTQCRALARLLTRIRGRYGTSHYKTNHPSALMMNPIRVKLHQLSNESASQMVHHLKVVARPCGIERSSAVSVGTHSRRSGVCNGDVPDWCANRYFRDEWWHCTCSKVTSGLEPAAQRECLTR